MKKIFIGLFVCSILFVSAYAHYHKDFLTGTWRVTKMEPVNSDIDITTLLALGLGKDQTISEVYMSPDTATFLNSKRETLAQCHYTYQKGSQIVLHKFPVANSFVSNEKDKTLIMDIGTFRYEFSKTK